MPAINVITGPTVLIEYAGLRFLTDPTFDAPQDYDMGITVLKKTAGAPITPESVLPIDAVLLSHDTHPDNLDTSGRALLPKVGHVITTEDGEKNLQAEGLTNVTGLAPWDTFIVAKDSAEVTVTAMPALHGPEHPRNSGEGRSRYWFPPAGCRRTDRIHLWRQLRTSRCRGNCSAHCSR